MLALAVVLAASAASGEDAPGDPATRARMKDIAAALRVALPASLSEERFADPARREALAKALASLGESTAVLERHGEARDVGFATSSRWLHLDAAEIARRFQEGRLEEARFLLQEMTGNCISCHARLPSASSTLGAGLFRDVDAEGLTDLERVRLQVVTRQFDAALASYEALFASQARSAAQLDLAGLLSDYLVVALRVESDPKRAKATLERFAARPDVPRYLAALLDIWIPALETLGPEIRSGDELPRARRVMARGAALRRFPLDRAGLIHDLIASSLLHRAVAGGPGSAEAYYLLGLTEIRNDALSPLTQAEAYLEAAIRMAPGSEVARDAYAVLEEETLAGYSGSSGLHLPPEVGRWLDELRALAEESPAAG